MPELDRFIIMDIGVSEVIFRDRSVIVTFSVRVKDTVDNREYIRLISRAFTLEPHEILPPWATLV